MRTLIDGTGYGPGPLGWDPQNAPGRQGALEKCQSREAQAEVALW